MATIPEMQKDQIEKWIIEMTLDTFYHRYEVEKIVRPSEYEMTKERLTELFLLGATFDTTTINGIPYKIVVYENTLYLMKQEPEYSVY